MGKLCEHPAHEADRDQRPIQTPTGWFHEAKSDVEISTIMPILEPIAGAIMKIGGAILNSPPYQKHSAEEQPCSNNNGRQTAGPSTRRGVTTAPASALAPCLASALPWAERRDIQLLSGFSGSQRFTRK
ncbi:hypothetical protein FRC12_022784 [Ceratobasidium sp. 428]|nr:hypothetical protein FRC12_022784 [Ceratobasidium sp. 428]